MISFFWNLTKVKRGEHHLNSLFWCRNPSFGLVTKAKGVARLRAKRKEARELEARSGRKESAFDGQGSKRKQLQLLKENLNVNEDIDLFF